MFQRLIGLACLMVWLNCGTSGSAISAPSYEDDLAQLAKTIDAQLEKAGQINGTVLDFTDLQGQQNELGRFLAQELSDKLVGAAKSVSFLDRAGLQYLLKENKLSAEGLIDPRTTRKLGNLIGVDTLIFGTATPLGDSIRISVRGIAVETGKIVASASATLPGSGGLADLYTHGVSQNQAPGGTGVVASSGQSARDRFRADSIKFTARDALSDARGNVGINFSIENHSGIGIGVGLVNAISLGSCVATGWSGISEFGDDAVSRLKQSEQYRETLLFVPNNGIVTVSAHFYESSCSIGSTTDLTATIVVAAGEQVFNMPLSVPNVRVRNQN